MPEPPAPDNCPDCQTELAPGFLSCPNCRRLVHKETLQELSTEAGSAIHRGDQRAALESWRRALDLLPPDSKQHAVVLAKVQTLSDELGGSNEETAPALPDRPGKSGLAKGGAIAGIALLIWKFKAVGAFVLTKGKFLLAGLTKSSTFFSMFLSLGVYWTAWGWKFAAGLVVSIYVHEMGHVAALRHYGIKATAPVFIPGVGALVRLKQHPATVTEDARVGLAGPLWGLGAAVVAYLVFLATDWGSWAAIAKIAAWINLFNLLPVWQLDGGRGFRALTRRHRWFVVAAIGTMWFFTSEGMLVLLLLFAIMKAAMDKSAPTEPDNVALGQFLFLVVTLSLMCMISVPGLPG